MKDYGCFHCGALTEHAPGRTENKGRVFCSQTCLREDARRNGPGVTETQADKAMLVKPGSGRPIEKIGGIPL